MLCRSNNLLIPQEKSQESITVNLRPYKGSTSVYLHGLSFDFISMARATTESVSRETKCMS